MSAGRSKESLRDFVEIASEGWSFLVVALPLQALERKWVAVSDCLGVEWISAERVKRNRDGIYVDGKKKMVYYAPRPGERDVLAWTEGDLTVVLRTVHWLTAVDAEWVESEALRLSKGSSSLWCVGHPVRGGLCRDGEQVQAYTRTQQVQDELSRLGLQFPLAFPGAANGEPRHLCVADPCPLPERVAKFRFREAP